MNCEAYQDLVAAHVDGALTSAEHQEVGDTSAPASSANGYSQRKGASMRPLPLVGSS